MEQYIHYHAKELKEQLNSIPPDAGLTVKFDDDAIQRAQRVKHVLEIIERLQKTATDADSSELLLRERELDRQRDERKLRY